MFVGTLLKILSLVLLLLTESALAGENPDHSSLFKEPAKIEAPADRPTTEDFDSFEQNKAISIALPKDIDKVRKKNRDFFYPYTQSMSPKLGLLFDMANTDSDDAFLYLLGVNYMLPRYRSPQLELSADLISNSTGHLSAVVRWILFERNSFRPFYKAGLTHKVEADQQLGSFTNLDNYLIRVGAGLEEYLKDPASIRLEAELSIGLENIFFGLILGYSWGWNP